MRQLTAYASVTTMTALGDMVHEQCQYTLHVESGRTVLTVSSTHGQKQLFGSSIPAIIKAFDLEEVDSFLADEAPWLSSIEVSDYEKKWLLEERPTELDIALTSKKLIWGCSPALPIVFPKNAFEDWFYSAPPTELPIIHRAKNTRELTKALFGSYRRDLERCIINSNWNAISWAIKFRNTMPPDWISEFLAKDLNRNVSPFIVDGEIEHEHIFIKSLSKLKTHQTKNLLEDVKGAAEIHDTRTNYEKGIIGLASLTDLGIAELNSSGVQGWNDLIVKINKLPAEALKENHSFPETEIVELVAKAPFQDFRVTWLNNSKKLQATGKAMKNCCGELRYTIGGYEATDSLFLFENKTKMYLMQISKTSQGNWEIIDFRGYDNKEPSKTVKTTIYDHVYGILKAIPTNKEC